MTKSNDITRVGAPLNYNPDTSYTLWNRYEFRHGPLKGMTVGAGLRHSDAARLSGDPLNVIIMPSFTTVDFMISHRFTVAKRVYRAQLNIKNLTDKLYRDGTDGYFADLRRISLSVGTRF